jgi:hypothetical protein
MLLRDRACGETIAAPDPFFFRRIKEDQHWYGIAADGGCLHDALLCFSTSVEKTFFVRSSNSKSPEFDRQTMPVATALLCDRNEIAEIRTRYARKPLAAGNVVLEFFAAIVRLANVQDRTNFHSLSSTDFRFLDDIEQIAQDIRWHTAQFYERNSRPPAGSPTPKSPHASAQSLGRLRLGDENFIARKGPELMRLGQI